jgi:hypothetical protein
MLMMYPLTTLKDGAKADVADIIIRVMRDRDKQKITKI